MHQYVFYRDAAGARFIVMKIGVSTLPAWPLKGLKTAPSPDDAAPESAFWCNKPAAFEKIAAFDGSAPAQVTNAWGIMPLYQGQVTGPLGETSFCAYALFSS